MLKRLTYMLCCISLFVNLTGCAVLFGAAAGGVGTSAWLSGKLNDEINASYENTVIASKNALASLNMPITKEVKTSEVTQIRSEYADGQHVWIDIRPLTRTASKIEIRVGIKGDKAASLKILERIKREL
jgi:hypothetical protein